MGKLAVLTPGLGAVSTTLFAGVEAIQLGIAKPIGSFTQLGQIQVGTGPHQKFKRVDEMVPLVSLEDLVFGAWDPFLDSAYEAAFKAKVLDPHHLESVKDRLSQIRPMSAVFDRDYVKRIQGPHVKTGKTKMDLADQLREDIQKFMKSNGCDRAVMIWCASTEVYSQSARVHETLQLFEEGLKENNAAISPSQIYTYAALKERVPYINGSPNFSVEASCLQELAHEMRTPTCGSDFKTGQTFLKTVIAPGLRNRLLGVSGWYSTNILGNRDGEVLDDPGSLKSKEITKTGVLSEIFSEDQFPDLYKNIHHVVKINYYPPRGDQKEGWDNIDIFGWLGYPMQIKINFLCRDSILAAPIALDLVLLMDLAARAGKKGLQDWLSFYFKAPASKDGLTVHHDLNLQLAQLEDAIKTFSDLGIE